MDWYRNIRKGAQGELIACVDLMDHGYEVFRAQSPADSVDLIAHKHGSTLRVQVKATAQGASQIEAGKQDVVAWVDVDSRWVTYDPPLPEMREIQEPKPLRIKESKPETTGQIARAITDCVAQAGGTDAWRATFRHVFPKNCDIRTVTIEVKEFSYDPPHVRGPFHCPNCKEPLRLEKVQNCKEWREYDDLHARCSVNRQIFERDERTRTGMSLVAIDAAHAWNDALPDKAGDIEQRTTLKGKAI